MSLGDDLPVEPLSEGQWDRIEEGLFAELDAGLSFPPVGAAPRRAGRMVAVGGVLVVATAAAALAFWVSGEAPSEGRPLSPTRIVSGEGDVETTVGDAVARLSPHTTISVLGDAASGFVVMMETGEVTFVVPARGVRPTFVVQAGPTRVEVVGTEFTVAYGQETTVRVAEGTVRVTREGDLTLLRAGERWSTAAPALADPDEAPEPLVEPEVAASRATEPERDAPRYDPRGRFEKASQLEPTSADEAIAIYAELARRGGSWGEVALYAQARAELERGNETAATRLLRRYLRLHPDGDNAQDARLLLEASP
jgi:hypothetical protein